jgi:hypothetical protein
MEPFEIIASPFTVWAAPVGEAFPDVDTAPAGNWSKIGTSGDRNYTEEGVVVSPSQSIEKFRPLGATGPVKAWRVTEDMAIRFTLADLSLEQLQYALNGNTVTDTPAAVNEPGTRKIGLSRGHQVTQYALLVRGGVSPYGDFAMQFEVPVAILESSQEIQFQKGTPAGLLLEWSALEDPEAESDDERFGRLVAQDANALPPEPEP